MKFLRLFLSADRRLPIRPTIKNFSCQYWPQVGRRTSDRGNVKRIFLWSVGPSVGGESDGKGHCRMADRRKFLLFFRTAPYNLAKVLILNYCAARETIQRKIMQQTPT